MNEAASNGARRSTATQRSTATERCRVLVVGVGGQGALTAARWLGEAAMDAGLDVRIGQLHGMSQRGGSVEASVSIGPGHSSLIADGAADLLVALEPLELLRARRRMGPHTCAVTSTGQVVPLPLAMKGGSYPALAEIVAAVQRVAAEVVAIDATALAERAASLASLNVVLLGAASATGLLPFGAEPLLAAIARHSPARAREQNARAFEAGAGALRAARAASGGASADTDAREAPAAARS